MFRRRPFVALMSGLLLASLAAFPAFAEEEGEGTKPEEKAEKKASAGLGVGDAAVDFEGREFINTDPVSLRALRGRVVLLELFSTG